MRALALRGFCISVGLYAEAGKVVELSDTFYAEMHRLGAVEPAPVEEEEQVESAEGDDASPGINGAEPKKSKSRKSA